MIPQTVVMQLLRPVARLVRDTESDPQSITVSRVKAVKQQLIADAIEAVRVRYFDRFVPAQLRKLDMDPNDVPNQLRRLYEDKVDKLEVGISDAFADLEKTVNEATVSESFLARTWQWLWSLVSSSRYREGGTVEYNGRTYWRDLLFVQADKKPVRGIPLNEIPGEPEHHGDVAIDRPVLLLETGRGYVVLDGKKRVAEAKHRNAESIPARVLAKHEMEAATTEAVAVIRRRVGGYRRMKLLPYVKLLLKTVPASLHREAMAFVIEDLRGEALFHVVGGVRDNSANTCRWANNKVFTKQALEYLVNSSELKDHLYHPNCYHSVEPPAAGWSGKVWTLEEVRRRNRAGVLR